MLTDGERKRERSLDLDHFGIRFADRKLVASHRDLDRVAERRDLADVDGSPFSDSHVHDPPLDRSFSVEPSIHVRS